MAKLKVLENNFKARVNRDALAQQILRQANGHKGDYLFWNLARKFFGRPCISKFKNGSLDYFAPIEIPEISYVLQDGTNIYEAKAIRHKDVQNRDIEARPFVPVYEIFFDEAGILDDGYRTEYKINATQID